MTVGPGTVLGGRYRLDGRIAGGGMGEVWRGTDQVLARTVAIKILLPALLEEPGFVQRFRAEARTMATINHPGVVNIYDYHSDPSVAYLVMEYIEGEALSKTLGRVGRLTPARTMALLAQAADALQAAHDKGIVHRDVKPGNLLVRPDGTLVLTDFGIARSAMATQLTAVGSVLGTASYISPEQASGSVATPLSDVYSLGVVGYQCLAGRRPFEGGNPVDIAMRHVQDQPPPLPADVPTAVRAIVVRALAKNPAARWPSASAMGAACRVVSGAVASGAPVAGALASGVLASGAAVAGGPVAGRAVAGSAHVPRSAPVPLPRSAPVPAVAASAAAPPGGTRVLAEGGPGAMAGPSGAVRGAAAVPPPVGAEARTGYAPALDDGRRGLSGPAIAGIVAGFLLLLLVLGTGSYLISAANRRSASGSGSGADAAVGGAPSGNGTSNTVGGQSPATTAPPQAPMITIDCAGLKGKTFLQADWVLTRDNFVVRRVPVPGRAGRVVDIAPCQGQPGQVITVQVGDGQRSGATPSASATCDVLDPTACTTPTSGG